MTTEPDFATLFAACAHSAVHLEMRDGYMADDPDFIAWQEGHRDDPEDRDSWWRPWLDLVAHTVGRGVVMRRARIVSEPISDYVQFEYDVTFTNVAAGERVRWLPRRQATDIALPGNDYWLFDDRLVLVNYFSGDGDIAGFDLIDDEPVVRLCSTAFETVWSRAIPHQEYTPTPQHRRRQDPPSALAR